VAMVLLIDMRNGSIFKVLVVGGSGVACGSKEQLWWVYVEGN